MKVRHLSPNPVLSDYVERILVIESAQVVNPFSLALFANGMPTLLFTSAKGLINNRVSGHLTLFGQTVSPGSLLLSEEFIMIAYFLKPISLSALFNTAGYELTDNPVDLNLILPKRTNGLQDRLLNLPNADDILSLLDNYLMGLIANAKVATPIVHYAAHRIAADPSKSAFAIIQKDLCVSERTFQRLFEKHIGINPNLYRRICQFNAAFQQLNNRAYDRLSDIAFENGYADQSHYIRTFKEFTNITPKDYFN